MLVCQAMDFRADLIDGDSGAALSDGDVQRLLRHLTQPPRLLTHLPHIEHLGRVPMVALPPTTTAPQPNETRLKRAQKG